jgi:hypothetical protein
MRRATAVQQQRTSRHDGHDHGQRSRTCPQPNPGPPRTLPLAPAGRLAATVLATRTACYRPPARLRSAAGPAAGFFRAAWREPAWPAGPNRLTRAGPVVARGSRRPARARRSVPVGFTARVAVPAGLPAGPAAGPPVSGPPASGPSAAGAASRAADTGTTACGSTGTRTTDTRATDTPTTGTPATGSGPADIGTTLTWPRVDLPSTCGAGRGRGERVPARGRARAEAGTTARVGVRTASGTRAWIGRGMPRARPWPRAELRAGGAVRRPVPWRIGHRAGLGCVPRARPHPRRGAQSRVRPGPRSRAGTMPEPRISADVGARIRPRIRAGSGV